MKEKKLRKEKKNIRKNEKIEKNKNKKYHFVEQ